MILAAFSLTGGMPWWILFPLMIIGFVIGVNVALRDERKSAANR